jgi:Tfp pilus assembly protein PilO
MNKQNIQNKKSEVTSTSTDTKSRVTILAIVFILLLGVSIFWYIEIIKSASEIRDSKKIYDQEIKDTQLITEIKNQQRQAGQIEEFMDSLYIEEENAVSFVEYVEQKAANAGVRLDIKNFDIIGGEEVENKEMKMSLVVTGSWSQINKFIVVMENLPFYSVIEKFSIKANTAEGGAQWSAEFQLKGLTK